MNATSSRSLARPLRAASLLLALGSAAACTAILAPKDDVQRCGNSDDCDPIDDNRYVPACQFDEANSGLDTTKTDKICVADYNPQVGCDPMNYQAQLGGEHPFFVTWDKSSCGSPSCPEESKGKRGCPLLDGGGCLPGEGTEQTFGEFTFCGDAGEIAAYALNDELEGQQVKDQFCKSFFCDEDFVCNDNNRCGPCDPDLPYGQGGCGIVVNDGGPAAVYVLGEALEDQCAGPDADTDEPLFGAC